MASIGARIALWYTAAATATLGCVFVAGYHYLDLHLTHGLDILNEAEFRQIQSHLGPEFATSSSPFREMRVREITENAAAVFLIEVQLPDGSVMRSSSLNGNDIPDQSGPAQYNARVEDIGELRVGQFSMQPFQVVIGTPLQPVQQVMSNYIRVCAALLLGMVVVSLLLGFGLSRMLLQPVRLIRDTANRIRSDNLGQRIPVDGARDEISDLAQLLNQMFDRLESSFAQIRRFTAEASHELKTPLSLIRLHAEKLVLNEGLSDPLRESAQIQLEEIERLNRIIEDLLLLSRADARAIALQVQDQVPQAFLQSFDQDAAVLLEHHGLRYVSRHTGQGTVAIDTKWMRQVLLNLLTNAIHVSPSGAEVRVTSECEYGVWHVAMEDQGPGLPVEQRELMFERFFRFQNADLRYSGTGLGLAISRSIVELHGGRIRAENASTGSGLRIVIRIDRHPPA
ncbi:HAMP domain-containing sensor histidine kinase [Diaphorobacter caeni]|uniref:HAMP domain-containing sensor histidine kinase n=1 Tax=Diaphorobacter caeni TaxID=2784387 RepID=UPI00188E0FEE|nr:ATP-binding protein [Diaphorobacter caeni]MBF5007327.1 HAMP domain-containing protein [Diaphorobacter caeni]